MSYDVNVLIICIVCHTVHMRQAVRNVILICNARTRSKSCSYTVELSKQCHQCLIWQIRGMLQISQHSHSYTAILVSCQKSSPPTVTAKFLLMNNSPRCKVCVLQIGLGLWWHYSTRESTETEGVGTACCYKGTGSKGFYL